MKTGVSVKSLLFIVLCSSPYLIGCLNGSLVNIYEFDRDGVKGDRERVYFEHLKQTFQQNPEVVISALIEQEKRTTYSQKIFTDQFGRHFVWHPQFGYVPHHTNQFQVPYPVHWVDIPGGRIPVTAVMNPSFSRLRGNPFACIPKATSVTKQNEPTMSFYEPPTEPDPCVNYHHSEFGVTATSGMADIMCVLCQWLKSTRCMWQFCTHPEGVYKINLDQ